MTPKRVRLDKEARAMRLALIKERYEQRILGVRHGSERNLLDAFIEDEDFEAVLD